MSHTYVVPDIHGRFDLLSEALSQIEKDQPSGTVVFLGDYVDRGPNSKEVLARLIQGSSANWTWHLLRGNHEDMMLAAQEGHLVDIWVSNGGGATISSYDGDVTKDHLEFVESLKTIHWDKHRVYVHAGVDAAYPLKDQPEGVTQWMRYPAGANIGYKDLHVVHGHTPKRDGPELFSNRTNLDTGAVFTGRLVVGVFDDEVPGGPQKLIEVGASRNYELSTPEL